MSQGGDGIHHLSWGVTVAENLSMGVNQGNYYVLGGYEKFFLHRGVFLFTGIAHCAAPRSHGVSEMKSWLPGKKRGGARKGSERRQLGRAIRVRS